KFVLARDTNVLYYVKHAEHVGGPFKKLREQFKHIDYGHGVNQFSQVWKLDLKTWREEKVIDAHRVIKEMTVSFDGQRIAMITTPDDTVVSCEGRSRVDVYDANTKKTTTLTTVSSGVVIMAMRCPSKETVISLM